MALLCAAALVATTACEKNNDENGGTALAPQFEIEVSNIATTSAWISVTPSDRATQYYFDLIPEEDYVALNGDVGAFFEEIIAYYKMMYPTIDISLFLQNMLSTGPAEDSVMGLKPGTTYYAYAVAVDSKGNAMDGWVVEPFTTLEGGNPAACTFDFTFGNIFSTEVEFTITPSDESVAYWYAVTAVEGYPGDVIMQNDVKSELESYASANGYTVAQVVDAATIRGTESTLWYELESDTSYYVYAYAMNEDGTAAGPVYKKQFTTTLYDISDAEISVVTRVFDGDELYASDAEKFSEAQGVAVVQIEATPNSSAAYWLMMLAGGDMTDTTIYPDDTTINAMLEASSGFNKTVTHYYVPWGSTATLLYFAADSNMLYGPLTRQLLALSKDNTADISLYKEAASQTPSAVQSLNAARTKSSAIERKMQGKCRNMLRNIKF